MLAELSDFPHANTAGNAEITPFVGDSTRVSTGPPSFAGSNPVCRASFDYQPGQNCIPPFIPATASHEKYHFWIGELLSRITPGGMLMFPAGGGFLLHRCSAGTGARVLVTA